MRIILLFAVLSFLILSCKTTQFTKRDVKLAQKLYGLEFGKSEIDTIYPYLQRNSRGYDSLRKYELPYSTFPALQLNHHPFGFVVPTGADKMAVLLSDEIQRPKNNNELAFLSITEMANLMRSGQLSSAELTKIYLERLKKYNDVLHCAITIIEDEALAKAREADKELQNGMDRGLLHGIPYGIKDLIAVKGYPTTWGAMPFKDQIINETATVVHKLENAGAILIAKLTSGALARGDVWYGGKTLNPWDLKQGASGSSAGSASATAAGLVAFSLGTETLGSITSPSNRNGVTGHRPTYGRVSRDGVMSLAWSMDKVGPICRSAQDCAIVFSIIEGLDPKDKTTVEAPFFYTERIDMKSLKVGVLQDLIDQDTTDVGANIKIMLARLSEEGITPDTLVLPADFPFVAYDIILRAEAGASFDNLVRSGRVDMMVQQDQRSRANSLRQARFIPAVEYIQANRSRTLLIEQVHQIFQEYDVIITTTFGKNQLLITNLTGHPVVTIPIGFDKEGHPTSMSFLGNLYDDGLILSFANAIQQMMSHHLEHPKGFIEE